MIRSVVLAASAASVALLATHVPAQAQQPGTSFKDCRDCPEMVVVPAGSFTMGSSDAETIREGMEPDARRREQPAHTVTLARPFAIGRFEVTRRQYAVFARQTRRPSSKMCTTWNQDKNAWLDVEGATWDKPNFPQRTNTLRSACRSRTRRRMPPGSRPGPGRGIACRAKPSGNTRPAAA